MPVPGFAGVARKNFNYFCKQPSSSAGLCRKRRTTGNPAEKNCRGINMTSNEVLSMYENIAGLTGKMAVAAQSGDWTGFDSLQAQCAAQASATATGVPALDGAKRLRKIDLLKQIMANDRAVRDVTEPWMGQLDRAMRAH
jgi:flagellar protein FliT